MYASDYLEVERNQLKCTNVLEYACCSCYMVRSPWSNKYDPPLDDGALPSDKLRTLEVQANQAFDTYRELYFEGGICSVYLWDLDNGFAGVVLLKKGTPELSCGV